MLSQRRLIEVAAILAFLAAILVGLVLVTSAFTPEAAAEEKEQAAKAGIEEKWSPFLGPEDRKAASPEASDSEADETPTTSEPGPEGQPPVSPEASQGPGTPGGKELDESPEEVAHPEDSGQGFVRASGVLLDSDGRPLAGVPLEVWDSSLESKLTYAYSITGSGGEFAVSSPQPNFVIRPGVSQAQLASHGLKGRTFAVSVPEGTGGVEGLRLVLERASVGLGGRVVDATGRPAAGLGLRLVDSRAVVVGQVVTDSRGNYSFADLPPGVYKMLVDHPSVGSIWVGGSSFASAGGVDLRASVRMNMTVPAL